MWRPLQRDEEAYHIASHDKVETTTYPRVTWSGYQKE